MEENVNPEPNKNKSNKGIFIVVAVMAIIIVALGGYIIVKDSNDSKKSGGEENKVSTSKVSNEIDEDDDDDKDSKKEKNTSKKNETKNTSKKNESKNSSKDNTNVANESNTSKKSAFGKKNKNNTNTNNTENTTSNDTNTNTTNTPSTSNNTTTEVSGDWKSGEFSLDGVAYKLNCDYKDYTTNGWSIDLSKSGHEDGYILNKKDKTYSTIDFINSKFDDANITVGFINLSDTAKDITECQIWAMSVNNKFSDTPVNFTLPGGIKNGSTLAEVEAAYGKPEADNIYRSEDLGYTTYTYDNNLAPQLRLTIYDNEGVTEFNYKIY